MKKIILAVLALSAVLVSSCNNAGMVVTTMVRLN